MGNKYPKDNVTPEKRSWIMSRIKSKDTNPELKLRRELWRRGLRYRKDYRGLPGKPDIVFAKSKVVVFVDGAFWHGKKLPQARLNLMTPYWKDKIQRNMNRDTENNSKLQEMGYIVLRFLDFEIIKKTTEIANRIEEIVSNSNRTSL
jgi:DNA mismatch endonuclease (patch repair protein)